MKTYIKPIAEVKEFNLTNNIASLDSFLGGAEAQAIGLDEVITAANITSYSNIS